MEGIFAGGDVVTGPAYVIDAIAAGKKAARSMNRYLKGEPLVAEARGRPEKLSEAEAGGLAARVMRAVIAASVFTPVVPRYVTANWVATIITRNSPAKRIAVTRSSGFLGSDFRCTACALLSARRVQSQPPPTARTASARNGM